MTKLVKRMCQYLDRQDVKYEVVGENDHAISVRQKIDGSTSVLNILLITNSENDDDDCIQIKIYNLCTIQNVSISFMKKLNTFNAQYRWYSIYMDDDNEIVLSADAVVNPNDPGDEIFELMVRGVRICEDLYPNIMKAAWS